MNPSPIHAGMLDSLVCPGFNHVVVATEFMYAAVYMIKILLCILWVIISYQNVFQDDGGWLDFHLENYLGYTVRVHFKHGIEYNHRYLCES